MKSQLYLQQISLSLMIKKILWSLLLFLKYLKMIAIIILLRMSYQEFQKLRKSVEAELMPLAKEYGDAVLQRVAFPFQQGCQQQANRRQSFRQWRNALSALGQNYQENHWQQFDSSFQKYVTLHSLCQINQSKFPSVFSQLKAKNSPQEIRYSYITREKQKIDHFGQLLERFMSLFLQNQSLSLDLMIQLIKLHIRATQFKQSRYISQVSYLQSLEIKASKRLEEYSHQCILSFQDILLFQKDLDLLQLGQINNYASKVMDNLHLIESQLKIQSIQGQAVKIKNSILEIVFKRFQEFNSHLSLAIKNIHCAETEEDYTILWNIQEKIQFFYIFVDSGRINLRMKFKAFKNELHQYCSNLAHVINTMFLRSNFQKIKTLMMQLKRLKHYQNIEQDIKCWIRQNQQLLSAKIKNYKDILKAKITIKQTRLIHDYRLFNEEYINSMEHYINCILMNTCEQNYEILKSMHEQIYQTNFYSLSNIDQLINYCIQIGTQQIVQGQQSEMREIYTILKKNCHYLTVIAQVYANLKRISHNFYLYMKNQLYDAQKSIIIDCEEIILKIQNFSKEKNFQTSNFMESIYKYRYYKFLKSDILGYMSELPNSLYKEGSSTQLEKFARLSREISKFPQALPCEHTNAIFVRVNEVKVNSMNILISGSKGTPYAHGLYHFELFCDDSFPSSPPKMQILTGKGQVRFNPNLYQNGYICLSLLGTWRGNPDQSWSPNKSTLAQIFISLQSLVMNEDVYFNEPGYQSRKGTKQGQLFNTGYSNIVKIANIKFAMTQMIKRPPKGFELVVRKHFQIKKAQILQDCQTWLSQKDRPYENCGQNPQFQKIISFNSYGFTLQSQINELKNALLSISEE